MSIFDFLSQKLHMSEKRTKSFILTCPYRYKIFEIPKRNGNGKRKIAQPSKELKYIQRLVMEAFLSELPVHDSAKAYKKKTGIKNNVAGHRKNQFILKMDFENFFPSIVPSDLIHHIELINQCSISENDRMAITRLFFFYERTKNKLILSIGAPSSPFISNTLMFNFDQKVNDLCLEKNIVYTRYADDLTFSSNEKNVLFELHGAICNIVNALEYPRISINEKKTVFASKKCNRHVTGLVITNDDKISIGRSKKRTIKSLVHKYSLCKLDQEEIRKLQGYLAFIIGVEPTFIESLIEKYGEEVINKLKKGVALR